MKSEDDPEARIRELERPLAETARASETEVNQSPGKWAPSGPPTPHAGPAVPPPPVPRSPLRHLILARDVAALQRLVLSPPRRSRVEFSGSRSQSSSLARSPCAIGISYNTAHQLSRSGLPSMLPYPEFPPAQSQ